MCTLFLFKYVAIVLFHQSHMIHVMFMYMYISMTISNDLFCSYHIKMSLANLFDNNQLSYTRVHSVY